MNLLLDTHVVLWWLGDEPLSSESSIAISDPDNVVYVSAASIWEASIKQALGKLEVDGDFQAAVTEMFDPLRIDFAHAWATRLLPPHHSDPFDRMLIAQAQVEGLVLVSRDRRFAEYDVELLAA